ncbi:MAG: gamma-glutamylcyclotransferase [Saccharospirillum sp.]|nr:gamma-glutamylcyclotransferase [Saccharospirillum sp.]
MHCLFGYGSLICNDSRSRTGLSGAALAVEVAGIARHWAVPVPDYQATAVGALEDPQSQCCGVIFQVDDANLARFDEREQGYNRIPLPWHQVRSLDANPLPTEYPLWAYVGKGVEPPSPNQPIMQTYVDVILHGCLQFNEDFARRFLQTTQSWQHLLDDRHNPGYPRALNNPALAPAVDELLWQEVPDVIQERRKKA